MKIAVISDIHSAYEPFNEAVLEAKKEGFDQIIILGDLFTYGVDPFKCVELTKELISKDRAILIEGNHDLLYRELNYGEGAYYSSLPEWIRESVDWTWNELGCCWPFQDQFLSEWNIGSLLLAHANPFGFGDWTYLSNTQSMEQAASICAIRGYRFGVFGHLHRSSFFRNHSAELHVVGSIGQPRSQQDKTPSWAMIEFDGDNFSLEHRLVKFNREAHCASIWKTQSLSDTTKAKLCRYFQ